MPLKQAQPATPEADVSDGFNFFAQVDPRLLREYEELSADFVEDETVVPWTRSPSDPFFGFDALDEVTEVTTTVGTYPVGSRRADAGAVPTVVVTSDFRRPRLASRTLPLPVLRSGKLTMTVRSSS